MPAYTSPDNIQYPVSTDQVAPLETVFANLADSTQDALTDIRGEHALRTFRWANAAERSAQTGMQNGDTGFQGDTRAFYVYLNSAWMPAYSPAAYIEMTSSQSIPHNTATVVSTWTENSDAWGWHNPATNTSRITPTIPGRYQFIIQGSFPGSTAGSSRYYAAKLNGAALVGRNRISVSPTGDSFGTGNLTGEATFNGTTNYLEVEVFQNSGAALATSTTIVLRYLGPA